MNDLNISHPYSKATIASSSADGKISVAASLLWYVNINVNDDWFLQGYLSMK